MHTSSMQIALSLADDSDRESIYAFSIKTSPPTGWGTRTQPRSPCSSWHRFASRPATSRRQGPGWRRGTNGKGSVCATLDMLLRARGLRVGFYSSPHLVDFRERFRVDGVPVTEDDVVSWIADRTAVVERLHAAAETHDTP